MSKTLSFASLTIAFLMAGTAGTYAADVTYERLRNPEPQNWLMNHGDFGSHRFSSLNQINKTNVKNLKLAFAVPLGGKAGNEYVEATPLVRSEEHTSELQSRRDLVCRLLLEKKK